MCQNFWPVLYLNTFGNNNKLSLQVDAEHFAFSTGRWRNSLGVTRKAVAFPASSAYQPCGVVSFIIQALVVTFQPVKHSLVPVTCGERPGHCGEMVLLTMIARLADGLPLAASMQEDEQVQKIWCVVFFFLPLWTLSFYLCGLCVLSPQASAASKSNKPDWHVSLS